MPRLVLSSLALCLATPLLLAPASAADRPVRTLTVTRTHVSTATPCPLLPVIVAPGRRGMGEPGTYYARWDWGVRPGCILLDR